MTISIAVAAAAGVILSPWLRRSIERHAVAVGRPWRHTCHRCGVPRGARLPWTGRCPHCHHRIGPPAGVVEVVTAATLGSLVPLAKAPLELAAYAWVATLGVILAFVDLAVRRLPDRLTLSAFAGAALLLTGAALMDDRPAAAGRAVLTGVAVAAGYLLLMLLRPGGLGFGDVKLALATGTVLGWRSPASAVVGTAAGFLLSGLLAAALLATGRASRTTALPHGPFMLLGTLIGMSLR
ncbi:MAG TPA: A24 family peptidase [Micromonospora sp.]